jgi:hypothetical protein
MWLNHYLLNARQVFTLREYDFSNDIARLFILEVRFLTPY